jgi:hypothetical protein
MGKNYVRHNDKDGYESGYESEGGTKYSPEKELGTGNYAVVRQFTSKNNKKKWC